MKMWEFGNLKDFRENLFSYQNKTKFTKYFLQFFVSKIFFRAVCRWYTKNIFRMKFLTYPICPQNPICPKFSDHQNETNRRMHCIYKQLSISIKGLFWSQGKDSLKHLKVWRCYEKRETLVSGNKVLKVKSEFKIIHKRLSFDFKTEEFFLNLSDFSMMLTSRIRINNVRKVGRASLAVFLLLIYIMGRECRVNFWQFSKTNF